MQSIASLDERPAGAGGRGASGTLTLTCVHLEPKRQHALQTRGDGGSVVHDPLMHLVEEQFRGSFERMNELIEDRILGVVVGRPCNNESAISFLSANRVCEPLSAPSC